MKKSARLFCLLALAFAASAAASGQSLSRSWYNGSIVLDADEHADGSITLSGMAEGEEHEFTIVPTGNEAGEYRVLASPHAVQDFDTGTIVRHMKREGWEVLCNYNEQNQLVDIMEACGPTADATKMNIGRWKSRATGQYTGLMPDESELHVQWTWDELEVFDSKVPYHVIEFNGIPTGFIRIDRVEGAYNDLQGIWRVTPTREGFLLARYDDSEGNTPWEWKSLGFQVVLTESNPDVSRFDFASKTLLISGLDYDKPTLRLMRNAILARHGYRFQSPDLQEYFGGEPWYKPADTNDAVRLSFLEELNVALIKYAETRR